MANGRQMSNPQIIAHLMYLTFGMRRNMLIEKVNIEGNLQYHAIIDIVNRFPFIVQEEYVCF